MPYAVNDLCSLFFERKPKFGFLVEFFTIDCWAKIVIIPMFKTLTLEGTVVDIDILQSLLICFRAVTDKKVEDKRSEGFDDCGLRLLKLAYLFLEAHRWNKFK